MRLVMTWMFCEQGMTAALYNSGGTCGADMVRELTTDSDKNRGNILSFRDCLLDKLASMGHKLSFANPSSKETRQLM